MSNEYGGLGRRFVALLIDGLIVTIGLFIILFILGIELSDAQSNSLNTTISNIYMWLIPTIWTGYTIGKKALNIKIEKLDGSDVTLWTMFLRQIIGSIVYALSFGILFIVSVFMVIIREDKRAIHDFIAGTCVVKTK
ncbi:RDD family protein [Sutcliffiella halmapala]|uniref:RDD family protein n=1 Tax=Sutcliffiella halmapala TaxID=79882 RepID=UPI001F1D112A|nr:RDD family protein [Sutcliffiella halmapala]